jgi:hypothetical protein
MVAAAERPQRAEDRPLLGAGLLSGIDRFGQDRLLLFAAAEAAACRVSLLRVATVARSSVGSGPWPAFVTQDVFYRK